MSDSRKPSQNVIRPVLSLQVLEIIKVIGLPPENNARDINQLRRFFHHAQRALSGAPEPVARIEDIDTGGVPARLYTPENDKGGVLVWLHGGGWVLGGLDEHNSLLCAIANRARCSVLSVDYRLAPENPYPAAINDCWTSTKWALEHYDRVAIGGDSAGGNLAAAVALRARDSEMKLALQLLVYPVLDSKLDSDFLNEFVTRYEGFMGEANFGKDSLAKLGQVWRAYVAEPERLSDVDASPSHAASLSGLAPALIILSEHDILRGEGEQYAKRIQEAGVPVELYIYAGQTHGFYNFLGVVPDARDAVERTSVALRAAFEKK
jgi:acetyl esterase